jgi:glycolate oxidase FAD binding subunit
MQRLDPGDAAELAAMISDTAAAGTTLLIEGGGTRAHVGRPVEADVRVGLDSFAGIVDYDPMELVLTAGPATRLDAVEALLSQNGQMLAFEPPRAGPSTLGGAIAANASGPRRFVAGAARDHLLGFEAVSGRGDVFKAGGRVVKNVTGFDLSKLIAGSWGTLAVVTQLSVKVLPRPRATETLLLLGLSGAEALTAMAEACGSPAAISGAAHLPHAMAARSGLPTVAGAGTGVTALRLEGFKASVDARMDRLQSMFRASELARLDDRDSMALWTEIRDVDRLVRTAEPLWRLTGTGDRRSLPRLDEALLDWAGSLVWLAGERPEGAVLWRGSDELRQQYAGAPPRGAAHAKLAHALKRAFDPADILNRNRLHPPLAGTV